MSAPSYLESVTGRVLYDVTQFRNGPPDRKMEVWEIVGRRSLAELTFLALPILIVVEMIGRIALTVFSFIAIVGYLTLMRNCCSGEIQTPLTQSFEPDSFIPRVAKGICMGAITGCFACHQMVVNLYKEKLP